MKISATQTAAVIISCLANFLCYEIVLNLNKHVRLWRCNVRQCLDTNTRIMTRLKRPFRRPGVLRRTYQTKVFIALVFGVIFGFLFSYATRQCFFRIAKDKVKCKIVKIQRPKSKTENVTKIPEDTQQKTENVTKIPEHRPFNVSVELKTAKYFLIIGIMTAENYIRTRAKAIHDSWGNTSGSVKVIFFTGERGNASGNFDLVRLPKVDDTYPPQNKSFQMLKYVFEHYMGEFHWFVRADDDVYIRSDKLSEFLYGFDSSDDLLFGRAGVGKFHEKGKLGLGDSDNFCIGGVGVIMSQSLLRKVAPYLLTCLNETVTLHEDSELGRCIRRHVGVMCPWAQEVQHMFYQNFEKPERVFTNSLKRSPFRNAITVHPIKDPTYMLHLRHHFLTSDFLNLQNRAAHLKNRLRMARNVLANFSSNSTRNIRFELFPRNCTIHWEVCDNQFLYGLSEPPYSWVSGPILAGIKKLHVGVLSNINIEARRSQKSQEEFKKLYKASLRTHPALGLQLTTEVETLLKPLDTTGSRIPRRTRHFSHFQQSFAPLSKNILKDTFSAKNHRPEVNFIVPLVGRFETFERFLKSFEEMFLIPELPVCLLIVYFSQVSSPIRHKKIFNDFRAKHLGVDLAWSEMVGEFSRARALEFGVRRYGMNRLLFFADVDLIFKTEFYYRCRAGAILGQRVYFPLMFSQYNPQIVYYNRSASPSGGHSKFAPPWRNRTFTSRAGVWRKYSFGPVCVYSNDVIAVGGLNTTIRGWGLEDLDFYEKCLRYNLEVFRAPDLGLVHMYHAQTSCQDPRMNKLQAKMCEDSRLRGIGSAESLVEYMFAKGYL
ncbi:chondroitin sulfate synthase 1-like [Dendronephthya gigantea]|uniref:chondroitin sulfate synthase 1-like n=1 Tax=Dendronephthya gigantea TaxID=151771 RepID=UPI00106B57D1|nr:chondroitin sulfate synthase 1-like [Dendronephthya gigantea]